MRRILRALVVVAVLAAMTQVGRPTAAVISTQRVTDLVTGSTGSNPQYLAVMGDYVYFSAVVDKGRELYRSDGTTVALVKDIVAGAGDSVPQELTAVGNTLFFTARTPTDGRELWKSDGTAAGTVQVTNLAPNPASGVEDFNIAGGDDPHLTAVGDHLVFEGGDQNGQDKQLWTATAAAASQLYDFSTITPTDARNTNVQAIVPAGGSAFFAALSAPSATADPESAEGLEVYYSNGGAPILQEVRDGSAGGGPGQATDMAVLNGTLYFRGDDGSGSELWKTSGSGATLAADPGAGNSDVDEIVAAGGKVYFEAQDPNDGFSNELWVHDPAVASPNSTRLSRASATGTFAQVALGSNLLFGASDGTTGDYLWKTDGTPAGTVKIEKFEPNGGFGYAPIVSNGLAYIPASGTSDLWVSDGTSAGTFELADTTTGESTAAFNPTFLAPATDGGVFFAGFQSGGGNELYKTLNVQPDQPLTVGVAGPGHVITIPRGIDCGSDCSRRFGQDEVVQLYATPDSGETFTGWGGACTGTDPNVCSVTMSQARYVGAGFSGQAPPTGPVIANVSIEDVKQKEGKKGALTDFVFHVTLDVAPTTQQTVDFTTQDGSAKAGKDYESSADQLTFDPGVTSQDIHVAVFGDRKVERTEKFKVVLSNESSGLTIVDGEATGTIKNDDR